MTKQLANPAFDYDSLSPEEASELRDIAGEIVKDKHGLVLGVIKLGEHLHRAQSVLSSHASGVFGAFLAFVGLSNGTAYNAIAAFLEFGGSPNLENLEVSAMYALTKNEKAKKRALKLADKGVKVTHAMAKKLIADEKEWTPSVQSPASESNGQAAPAASESKPAPATEPDPDVMTLDSLGGPVPESLAEVFDQCEAWKAAMNAISQAKKLITDLHDHPAAGWLDRQETGRHLDQARTNLKFAMPHTECPKCRRKVKDKCEFCKGHGWLPRSVFDGCATDADKAWLANRK